MDIALKTPVAEGDPSVFRWGNRRDWFPGGRGAKGDILSKAGWRTFPTSGEERYFLVQAGKSLSVSTA